MESSNHPIERKDFEALIHAIGFEIEHAQVKLIVAANAQMLFHYWKLGNFILYHQKRLGWGGKVISQISKAIKMHYPEKERIFSEKPYLYVSVCPNIPTRDITKNAFL